jgi:hypothetical protein
MRVSVSRMGMVMLWKECTPSRAKAKENTVAPQNRPEYRDCVKSGRTCSWGKGGGMRGRTGRDKRGQEGGGGGWGMGGCVRVHVRERGENSGSERCACMYTMQASARTRERGRARV